MQQDRTLPAEESSPATLPPIPGVDPASIHHPTGTIDESIRLKLYRMQVRMRLFEKRAYDLFLQGLVKGTSHLSLGMEAIAAGFGVAMRADDWTFATYRGHAHTLARGSDMAATLGELLGRANGLLKGKGGSMHLTDVARGMLGSYAIVGAHLPIALGAAWSSQYRESGQVAVCFFGDGALGQGLLYEAMNMAALWKLPVIYVCENNLYGEYTRINLSTPVDNIAERAASYGMPGFAIDGQDVDEVISAVGSALERARAGDGPTLLEMKTYRYSGHSRSDPGTYRPEGELEAWKQRDPIDILRTRLLETGEATAEQLAELDTRVEQRVAAAVEAVLASPPPGVDEMLRHVTAAPG
jgi:acetoin:2,6-dichlorophenolindophenol oxidoreductase subunit alpha